MGAVEPGEHEEGRAVDARTQGQAQLVIGVQVFLGLKTQERAAQHDGDCQPQFERATMALFQGMVGDGQGDAGTDQ
ncbi:hypothetical protein D3C73_1287520 [compost metagenome]